MTKLSSATVASSVGHVCMYVHMYTQQVSDCHYSLFVCDIGLRIGLLTGFIKYDLDYQL